MYEGFGAIGEGLSAGNDAYQEAKKAKALAMRQAKQDAMAQEEFQMKKSEQTPSFDAGALFPGAPQGLKATRPEVVKGLEKQQELDATRKSAKDAKAAQTGVFNANQLRDEFNTLSKPFQTVVPMYQNVRESATTKNPTPQSDMKLIYAYMKILDPNSTVREGEYATAQNAGSIPDAVRNQWNRLQSGEKLQPSQRGQFATSALEAFRAANQIQGQHMKRYGDLSHKMGVDPSQVTYDYAHDFQGDLAPGAQLPWMQAPEQSPVHDKLAEMEARRKAAGIQ